jgi:general secretion pathway protein I
MRGGRAFTLLEVMVAVVILALSLSSLFSAQTTAIGATQYVKHLAVASQLGRCRMSELELEVLREGFEMAEFEDWTDGPCCELRDERVRLRGSDPFTCRWRFETVQLPGLNDAQNAAGDAIMEGDAEASEGMAAMGLLGPMLPMLQNLLEAAIRRVTVQVVWQDGLQERNVELVQYLTNPNQGDLGAALRGTANEEAAEGAGIIPPPGENAPPEIN